MVLRRILKLHLSASRMDTLADEQYPLGAEAGCLPGPHRRLQHHILQVDRPRHTEDSGLAGNHEADGGMGRI